MAKFSMHDFVADTLRRMIAGGETDWRVMQYAAGWYERGTLTDEDMAEVQLLIVQRDDDAAAKAERERLGALVAKYAEWEISEEGLNAHTIAELAEYMVDWGIQTIGCELKADYVSAILGVTATK